jgi:hypothetical protein
MIQPQMNADKRRLKNNNLSAFICVYPRPICLFQQPANIMPKQNTVPLVVARSDDHFLTVVAPKSLPNHEGRG